MELKTIEVAMNIKEAISTRRSVREFADQPVDKATVQELIQAAVQAPSAVNHHPEQVALEELFRSGQGSARQKCGHQVDCNLS